jgi:arylsulfatase A-like enzyme
MSDTFTIDRPAQPNIIFILTDQWRGDCLGVLGHPSVETPNLDEMARHGTLFTASYSACPSCIAARASLFTGLRPTTHGRLGYEDGVPWRYKDTLCEVLGRAGYQTHCVGKTHFFPQRLHLGFQSMENYEGAQNFGDHYRNDYWDWLREKGNGLYEEEDHGTDWNSWYARPSHVPEALHNNTWCVTRALDFLRRRDRTRPFFLNISFHRPHPPIDPPQAFFDMFRDKPLQPVPVGDWAARHAVTADSVNAWQAELPAEILNRTRRAYYAQIAHIDNQIGRLRMMMRQLELGPTWFCFTSDHGEMLGDHHLFRKITPYEGSAKTPLLLCPPEASHIHISDAPVSQQDFMPTFLDIANAPIPSSVEGRSFLPLTRKSRADAAWRDYVHGEHAACYSPELGNQFVTDGREKFIWFTKSGREQFFDLAKDPGERVDRISDPAYRDRVDLWRNRLITELAPRTQDGLSDGKQLIPGKNLPSFRPELSRRARS